MRITFPIAFSLPKYFLLILVMMAVFGSVKRCFYIAFGKRKIKYVEEIRSSNLQIHCSSMNFLLSLCEDDGMVTWAFQSR